MGKGLEVAQLELTLINSGLSCKELTMLMEQHDLWKKLLMLMVYFQHIYMVALHLETYYAQCKTKTLHKN